MTVNILFYLESPGLGTGPRVPFQRALSVNGKPSGGLGGPGRRPMLVKQENMMGSPDGYPGNMGMHRIYLFHLLYVGLHRNLLINRMYNSKMNFIHIFIPTRTNQ